MFFLCTNPLYNVERMTMSNSVGGLETSLEVFPDTLASFAHPGQTQNGLFDIPDHVPYYDLVRDLEHTKNTKNIKEYI